MEKVEEPPAPAPDALTARLALETEVETHSPTVEPVVFNPFEEGKEIFLVIVLAIGAPKTL